MKAINKISIGLIAAAMLIVGCSDGVKSAKQEKVEACITETSLGLRKVDLYTEDDALAEKTEYRRASAGSSNKIKRAFQDAPPMIPHDTTGLLPIKVGNNQCTGCHMPEVASVMGATPIPVSHLTDFRPKHKVVNGVFKKSIDNYKNEVSIKLRADGQLQGARFNCSQCHAPQSQGNLAVENTFQPQYTEPTGASKSTWQGGKLTDGLETIHGGDNFVTQEDIANKNSPAGHLPGEH